MRAGLSDAKRAAAVWKWMAKVQRARTEHAVNRQLELRRQLEAVKAENRRLRGET
jgi:hypothetical protein